ncbi:hypothetical protein cu1279 [Corynebacterium urealyticum DSM 7109]|uniref:Uncharacterized protein n=1 Tax=Corynebacterium urealyticum (strain ATCC 43042 / DSM 7109) TaxID=504474 RepID=B1VGD2_CORU7|nr:hypothetical protein cu1279 [Corynebacterium urealyticum DSM 7109]
MPRRAGGPLTYLGVPTGRGPIDLPGCPDLPGAAAERSLRTWFWAVACHFLRDY